MTDYVVDASAAVEYLLDTPRGLALAELFDSAESLSAPALLDAEVLSVVRREMLRGAISEVRALAALNRLRRWPVRRTPHEELLMRAWDYRHNVSAYDALYVALAEHLGAVLLTADEPLYRAVRDDDSSALAVRLVHSESAE